MIKLLGISCQILFVVCYIPQVIKIYKTKNVKDLSMPMWLMLALAILGTTIYVFNTSADIVLLAGYGLSLICVLAILIGMIVYRKRA